MKKISNTVSKTYNDKGKVVSVALSTIVCGFVFFDISLYVIIQFTADDYPMWILQILLIAYSTYYIRKR
jgi:hypothetical protein